MDDTQNQPINDEERQALFDQITRGDFQTETPAAAEEKAAPETKQEAPVETQPQAPTDTHQEPIKPSEPDPLEFIKTLPEEIQAQIKDKVEQLALKAKRAEILEHQRRSDQGRVAAYQGKYEKERRQREELQLQLTAQRPQTAQQRPNVNPEISSAEFKQLKEVDPTLAKAIEDYNAQREQQLLNQVNSLIQQNLHPVQQQQEYLATQREREVQLGELSVIDREMPNWKEIVYQLDPNGDPLVKDGRVIESPHWTSFKNSLPNALRSAVDNSNTAEDALAALQMYHNWAYNHPEQPWNKNPQAPVEAPQQSSNNNADRIAQKRQQDLRRTTSPSKPMNSFAMNTNAHGDNDEPDPSDPVSVERWRARMFAKAVNAIEKGNPKLY